jgi:hypothetical protein
MDAIWCKVWLKIVISEGNLEVFLLILTTMECKIHLQPLIPPHVCTPFSSTTRFLCFFIYQPWDSLFNKIIIVGDFFPI